MIEGAQMELFPGALPSLPAEADARNSTALLSDRRTPTQPRWAGPEQLGLDFRANGRTVVRLVPRTLGTFLGMRATSYFRNSPALYRLARRYRREGVIFLGDFLQVPTTQLLASLDHYEWLRALENELAKVGLALGDRFSWWRRPALY